MEFFDKILNWYFKRNSLPYWCILILDCAIIFASAIFAHWMFYRGYQTMLHFHSICNVMLIYIPICILWFKIFSSYAGIIRYSSFIDLQRVALANILAMVTIWILHYPIYFYLPTKHFDYFNSRMIVLMFLIATVAMWTMRVLVKLLYDITTSDKRALKTFIYGVNDGGVTLAKNIRGQKPTQFILRGFISPQPNFNHSRLMGEKVYCKRDRLVKAIEKHGIEAVLVSPLRIKEFQNDEALQDILISHGVHIYMLEERLYDSNMTDNSQTNEKVPEMHAMVLKEVSVEDLLPRDEIQVDMKTVGEELTGKRILITGAAGSIGSEIVRQVANFKPDSMVLIDQAETPEHDIRLMMAKDFPNIKAQTIVTSICNPDRMEQIFQDFRPEYVFHAAAYKHVPMMEDNPGEAVHNNIYGTKIIADLSVKYGVRKFVMVSTDKAVNPTNVMGCSKRICEMYVQSLDRKLKMERWENKLEQETTQFVTTRFGNVLGSNGSVIPLFREQIKKGGPVTVTDPNIIRYFMLIPEACQLVLEAGTKGNGGEIFVFDMGNPVKIADLAKRMISLSGAKNVEIKYTGLRPGEKLYEEVLNEQEGTKPTFNSKIRIASIREQDYEEICKQIEELFSIAQQYDDMEIVRKMKEIVPEFKSNNSKYEILDKEETEVEN